MAVWAKLREIVQSRSIYRQGTRRALGAVRYRPRCFPARRLSAIGSPSASSISLNDRPHHNLATNRRDFDHLALC